MSCQAAEDDDESKTAKGKWQYSDSKLHYSDSTVTVQYIDSTVQYSTVTVQYSDNKIHYSDSTATVQYSDSTVTVQHSTSCIRSASKLFQVIGSPEVLAESAVTELVVCIQKEYYLTSDIHTDTLSTSTNIIYMYI
jgi:uncharacterized Fe-S cluster protein YjdI